MGTLSLQERRARARKLIAESAPYADPVVVQYDNLAKDDIFDGLDETEAAEQAARPKFDAHLTILAAKGLGLFAVEEWMRCHVDEDDCLREGVGAIGIWKSANDITLVSSVQDAYQILQACNYKRGEQRWCDMYDYRITWYVGPIALLQA